MEWFSLEWSAFWIAIFVLFGVISLVIAGVMWFLKLRMQIERVLFFEKWDFSASEATFIFVLCLVIGGLLLGYVVYGSKNSARAVILAPDPIHLVWIAPAPGQVALRHEILPRVMPPGTWYTVRLNTRGDGSIVFPHAPDAQICPIPAEIQEHLIRDPHPSASKRAGSIPWGPLRAWTTIERGRTSLELMPCSTGLTTIELSSPMQLFHREYLVEVRPPLASAQ